jgi:hypothetical protein
MALQRAGDAHGAQGVDEAMAQTREPASKRSATSQAAPSAQERQSAAERRAARAEQARRERQRRQRRNLLLTALGVAVLVGVVALLLWRQQASQLGFSVVDQGREHVAEGTPLTYRYYPPASGSHYPSPQPAGVYRQEVPEGNWIHSLEHGYIVALVKCPDGCPDTFNQLEDLYKNGLPQSEQFKSVKFVVVAYNKPFTDPSKEAPVTLVAWDREMPLQSVDRDKIIAFYKQYVDKGPEAVP